MCQSQSSILPAHLACTPLIPFPNVNCTLHLVPRPFPSLSLAKCRPVSSIIGATKCINHDSVPQCTYLHELWWLYLSSYPTTCRSVSTYTTHILSWANDYRHWLTCTWCWRWWWCSDSTMSMDKVTETSRVHYSWGLHVVHSLKRMSLCKLSI